MYNASYSDDLGALCLIIFLSYLCIHTYNYTCIILLHEANIIYLVIVSLPTTLDFYIKRNAISKSWLHGVKSGKLFGSSRY